MAITNNERAPDLLTTIRDAINAALAGLWVSIPCIVESYDEEAVTITAQPTIQLQVGQPDGSIMLVDIPLLQDVPVMFPRGGGCTMTFPVKAGDECLVVFASRCIDGWWQSGGIQPPMENRKHDLSDGFAWFGPQSQPNKIGSISTTTAQLRSDDGQAYIELDPTSHAVNVKTPGTFTVDAGQNVFKGPVAFEDAVTMASGLDVTGQLKNNGKDVGSDHTHGGVQTGDSDTDPPK